MSSVSIACVWAVTVACLHGCAHLASSPSCGVADVAPAPVGTGAVYIALLGPTGEVLSHGVLWMPMGSETPTERLGGVYWMDRLDIFEIPVSSLAGTGFSADGVAAAVPDGFGKFQMVRNEPDRPMSLDLAPPYGDDWDILVLGDIQATTEARGTWYVQEIRGRVRIGDVIIIHEDTVPSKLEAYYRQVTWSSS